MVCPECGLLFDPRSLRQTLYHMTHEEPPLCLDERGEPIRGVKVERGDVG